MGHTILSMKYRIVIFAIIAILLGSVFYFFSLSHERQIERALNSSQEVPTAASPVAQNQATEASAATPAADVPAIISADDLRFQNWLAQEARKLDSPSVDSEKKQIEMRKIAQSLKPSQGRQLRKTALTTAAPAGQRILSAYLLVEGGLNTQEELRLLIQAPLENSGPVEVHSDNEVKSAQEKSLRIMAIDGLATRARTDARAREALAQAARESSDPQIRSHAQRRLQQL